MTFLCTFILGYKSDYTYCSVITFVFLYFDPDMYVGCRRSTSLFGPWEQLGNTHFHTETKTQYLLLWCRPVAMPSTSLHDKALRNNAPSFKTQSQEDMRNTRAPSGLQIEMLFSVSFKSMQVAGKLNYRLFFSMN